MLLSIIITILLAIGGIQAAPLVDFLPPVIIDDDQQILTNNKAHTKIFFLIGKYTTDVHYQIIRIPIHLPPVEQGLQRCGEVFHHMNNAIKVKATEQPIKSIIKFHNNTLHCVNFSYNKDAQKSPGSSFHCLWVQEEMFSGYPIWKLN